MIRLRTCLVLSVSVLFLLGLVSADFQVVNSTTLKKGWKMTVVSCPEQGSNLIGKTFQTVLPSTFHLDLIKNKMIEDPFFGINYISLKWLSLCTVKYFTKFVLSQNDLGRITEIVFHGIDTYSNVKLNGKQILTTKNAFVTYTAKITDHLLKDENTLEVIIQSAESYDEKGQKSNQMPFKYAHTRKACYQYSWDWAPEMITMGIWQDVELKIWDELKINYVWIRNKIISEEYAVLNFAFKLQKNIYEEDKLNGYSLKIFNNNTQVGEVQVKDEIQYKDVRIQKPKLWWPNGVGQPNIYEFKVELRWKAKVIQTKLITFGIRTVELDTTNKQFKVIINGHAVYCKGANYVPLDMLHPRISNQYFQTNQTYTYAKLFDDAVESNFNMIRLWGGGQYENDEFYELASRKGIMIFHDFMFSDSTYPSTKDFLENVQLEIKQQIRRIRNYPALALWSGNNQILQGIYDWGWGTEKYKKDYQLLFETLIRKVVEIESPSISYIPSSPLYGVGNYNFDRGGDVHYWGVWAGGSSFVSYQTAVGAFNSEFGTQALPVYQSIKQFTKPEQRNYNSPGFAEHERHNSKFSTLKSYISEHTNPSRDFQSQAYLSGVVQALGVQTAIRAQRSSKPKSYGTLYWQFNDAWPAISWAAIDYYGRWKALQYTAKRTYSNIAVFATSHNVIIAINDNLYPIDVVVKISHVKLNGEVITSQTRDISLNADDVRNVLPLNQVTLEANGKNMVTISQIYYKNKLQMRDTRYWRKFKQLELQKAIVTVTKGNSEKELKFISDKVVKSLFIDLPGLKPSDNYFDLVPGYPVNVVILDSKNSFKTVQAQAKFLSVREASIKGERLQVNFK